LALAENFPLQVGHYSFLPEKLELLFALKSVSLKRVKGTKNQGKYNN
jgi:hypothetical protein